MNRQPIEIQISINGHQHVERATPSDGTGAVAATIIPRGHEELPIRKLRSQRKKQTNSNEWLAKAEADMLNVQWESDQNTLGWRAVVNEYLYYRSDSTMIFDPDDDGLKAIYLRCGDAISTGHPDRVYSHNFDGHRSRCNAVVAYNAHSDLLDHHALVIQKLLAYRSSKPNLFLKSNFLILPDAA